jgi:hypothetical protein
MEIAEACAVILGDRRAQSIMDHMGIHWCVVAATAAATLDQDPVAIQTIREWHAAREDQK